MCIEIVEELSTAFSSSNGRLGVLPPEDVNRLPELV